MLKRLDLSAFDEWYSVLSNAFPKEERRSYEAQRRLFDKEEYCLYGLPYEAVVPKAEDRKVYAAFLAVWDFGDFAFIEHFAVREELRSKGLGANMLFRLKQLLDKPLVLECELPTANAMAERRIGFYERNGFVLNEYPYIQPSMGEGRDPIPLMLMTSPAAIDEETFAFYRGTLYKKVYETLDKKERV